MKTRSILAAAASAVAAAILLSGASAADAFISANTIDEQATYERKGTRVRVTGPIGCTRGERISIRVTATQSSSDARARARWKGRCTGELQHWAVRAPARQGKRFQDGAGRVCAVGRTQDAGRITDTRRWCRRVALSAGLGI